MTDSVRGAGGPPGPPWSVDVLADLHAGILDQAEAARLWPQVNADPEARAVLAALDEVQVGLGRLGNAPVEPMPAQYAARLDAALDAEMRASSQAAHGTSLSTPQHTLSESSWSVDVLADLHAGVLDPVESERLWTQVRGDSEAWAIITALDDVKVGLRQLGNAPAERMPARYAARLDAVLDAEIRTHGGPPLTAPPARAEAPVVDLTKTRKRRNRVAAWGAGALTAAAAVAAITVVALPGNQTDGTPSAQGSAQNTSVISEKPSTTPPLALSREDLGRSVGPLIGKKDYGQLKDEQGLKDCLAAHKVSSADSPLGVRPVTLDGTDGIAALVGAGTGRGHLRLVVVEPTCTKQDPGQILANAEIR
jgi:hypothetical protein